MGKILITGATGHLGTTIIEYLLKNTTADKIVALARNKEKATLLAERGIETRIGNFDDKQSLENALQGIDKVLLISGTELHRLQQHKNVVDASKKAGVNYIVYTGAALKSDFSNPFMNDHFKTEDYIRENGFTFTFLRNSFYSDALPVLAGEAATETGIFLPAGTGKVPFVLRRDLAEATANVLLQNGHENKTYELTGRNQYSFGDIANILSELSGKNVAYTNADESTFSETLRQHGLTEMMIEIRASFSRDIRNRQFEIISNDLQNLLGRTPADLKIVLKDIYNL